MTGGNDIHKVDRKRKIVMLIHRHSLNEADILEAIKQGQFTISNGIFSVTSDGHVFYHGRKVRVQAFSVLQARCYRLSRQGKCVCLRMGRKFLRVCGKHPK
jgi:hypothetical protein